jgi:hypothetical protein
VRKRRNDLITRLERLSQQVDMSIVELAEIASKIVSVRIDPIEPTGEPFVFQNRRPNCQACFDDPLWINEEVPLPDADVDLIDALEEYKRDAVRAAVLLESKPGIEQLLRIHQNQLDWFGFWAASHPVPEMRETFGQRLAEREAAMAQLGDRARAHVARRGEQI